MLQYPSPCLCGPLTYAAYEVLHDSAVCRKGGSKLLEFSISPPLYKIKMEIFSVRAEGNIYKNVAQRAKRDYLWIHSQIILAGKKAKRILKRFWSLPKYKQILSSAYFTNILQMCFWKQSKNIWSAIFLTTIIISVIISSNCEKKLKFYSVI